MKKRIRIIIICLSSILIILFVLAIINFIILPPKVSKNAQRYKFNNNNILNLKSITVDEDTIIYEFGSTNELFNNKYVEKRTKKQERSFLEFYTIEDYRNNSGSSFYSNNYEIKSTLFSNYLMVKIEEKEKIDVVYCFYFGTEDDDYDYLNIGLSNADGFENIGIGMRYDYTGKDLSIGKSQNYDKKMKKWDEIVTTKNPFSKIL